MTMKSTKNINKASYVYTREMKANWNTYDGDNLRKFVARRPNFNAKNFVTASWYTRGTISAISREVSIKDDARFASPSAQKSCRRAHACRRIDLERWRHASLAASKDRCISRLVNCRRKGRIYEVGRHGRRSREPNANAWTYCGRSVASLLETRRPVLLSNNRAGTTVSYTNPGTTQI